MYLKETAWSQTPEVLAQHQLSHAEPSFPSCLIWFLSLPAVELAGTPTQSHSFILVFTSLLWSFINAMFTPSIVLFSLCFLLLVVCLIFKFNLVWFKLLLVRDKNHVSFFCTWYPVFPIPFVEKNIFSPICILNTSIENYLVVNMQITFRPSILVYLSVFMPIPWCFDYLTFKVCIWSRLVYCHLFFSFLLR